MHKSILGCSNRLLSALFAILSLVLPVATRAAGKPPASKKSLAYTSMPLAFEPNRGQVAEAGALFTAKSQGYSLTLDATGARFTFAAKEHKDKPEALRLTLQHANAQSDVTGESLLPGKANYFPTGDPKSWITNLPTYSRVHYRAVYPGVDAAFYGTPNRLEYDFLIGPNADAAQIRMALSGAAHASLNSAGDLLLGGVHFLKPQAYQLAADGKTHVPVEARYALQTEANGDALVTFTLGKYDHERQLVIDPVVDALSYSQVLPYAVVGSVAADSAGNSYISGSAYYGGNSGIYVTKFNSSGTVVYTSSFGSYGYNANPESIAIDSSGKAYVAGYIGSNGQDSLPTTANAYQQAYNNGYDGFLLVVSADGSSVPYCTYLYGADTETVHAQGVALDSNGKVYLTGWTQSGSFPTTTGAYQGSSNPNNNWLGFVTKFDPTQSGASSLIYSTLVGSPSSTTYLSAIAVDSAGNAYLAANASNGYPVTSGAFQYSGYYAGSGGAYVTKLNPTGTALVYSAYLGYGGTFDVAVDGQGSAYATGPVSYGDFPTTAGAYQTSYPGGFAVKLSPDGSTELYSTFLSGPDANATPLSISLTPGCASACNAFIGGYTSGNSLPAINAVQSTPSAANQSAFIVELNATGSSALFSSYLSGNSTFVYYGPSNPISSNLYSYTPAIAVDGNSNIYVVGGADSSTQNASGYFTDFPITTGSEASGSPSYQASAFLAKISTSASAGFTVATPNTVTFPATGVGISTKVYGGTQTVRLSNYSSAAVTLQPIEVSPASIFSESDNCNGTIAAGSFCTLTLNFTPNASGARSGSVTVTSNAGNSPFVIPITATGVDQPYIQTGASGLTFGTLTVGTTSAPQTVTITNTGDQTAPVNVYNGGPNFAVLSNCPAQLSAGASCTATVKFTPTTDGLLTDGVYVAVSSPTGYNYNNSPGYSTYSVALSGTGTLAGATPSVALTAASLEFVAQTVGTSSSSQSFNITNTSTEAISFLSLTASGDFQITSNSCGGLPANLEPQQFCLVSLVFTPTAAGSRTGNLAIVTSVSATPQLVALSGTGVATPQDLQLYPSSALSFENTVVGTGSASETVYLQDTGSANVSIYKVYITGDFALSANSQGGGYAGYGNCGSLIGAPIDGTGQTQSGNAGYYLNPQNSCYFSVVFKPTATGVRTGALTVYDSAPGSPHVIQLTGSGIVQAGSLELSVDSLNFGPQPQGAASSALPIYFQVMGYPAVTVTNYAISGAAAGDFSVSGFCQGLPYVFQPGPNNYNNCYSPSVTFTPTATGTRNATLTIYSAAGNLTVNLTGNGIAGTQSAVTVPAATGTATVNFGPTVSGSSSTGNIYLVNTGTATLTTPGYTNITVSGPNASDFTFYLYYQAPNCPAYYSGQTQYPDVSCLLPVTFTPTGTGTETATLTFTNSFGTQTVNLKGTVVAAAPTLALAPAYLAYGVQLEGSMSSAQTVTFTNNGTSAVTLGNVTVTANFVNQSASDTCSGQSIAAAGSCSVSVMFGPTATGYLTGTLTFNDSTGKALTGVSTVPLAGYSFVETNSAYLDPTSVNYTAVQVIGTSAPGQTVTLTNTGNAPLKLGTLTNSNTTDFSLSDSCSGQTVAQFGTCSITVYFTPSVAGARTGTISFPVTYANNATATLTAALSGTGTAEIDAAVLTPPNSSFIDQAVGTTSPQYSTVYLYNNGNQAFSVGTLTNSNTTEFSFTDYCSGQNLGLSNNSCYINVYFTPSATGVRTGTITFPVSYADGTKANLTLPLSGNGVNSNEAIAITPDAIEFPAEIQTNTSAYQTITITNTGNSPVSFGSDSISGGQFGIYSDNCAGATLQPRANISSYPYYSYCTINVNFTPGSTATGNQTGTLTIADNSAPNGHTVALSGLAIPASQQLAVSQSTVAFGNWPAGSTSSTQYVYLTNQSDSAIGINSLTLAGTNAANFVINNNNSSFYNAGTTFYNCAYYVNQYTTNNDGAWSLNPRTSCFIQINFTPAAGTTGPLTATITETDSTSNGSNTIILTGTAVVAGPAAAFSPTTLAFPLQNVGTTSAAQNIGVTNTGTANMTVTNVVSTNATEFALTADGCSGLTLTPGQHCIVSLTFAPTLGGTRTGVLQVTDNATGSPQSLSLSGLGFGIPATTLNPTSLTFANSNIGATAATQTVTLTNSGTDSLAISGIVLTGANSGDFKITNNTCGSTLAPTAGCVVTISFSPTAAGNRGASLTFTDNATNLKGSTQVVQITGVGVATSSVSVTPAQLTFAGTNVGSSAAAQTITVTNTGSALLSIAGIAVGGANSADFTETNNCGSTLVAGASCAISVVFNPQSGGTSSRTATLTITDNANNTAGTKQTVALSGTATGTPTAALSPATLTFQSQSVGTTSAAQAVTVGNNGNGALTISGVSFGGTNSGDYAQTNTCGGSVAAGTTCTISVTFAPTGSGTRTAVLTLTDNAGGVTGTTQTVSLSGTGAGVPGAALSTTALTFTNQGVGIASASQTVTLTNNGTAVLTVSSIAVTGGNAGDFAATNNCNGSVAVGGACNIVVTFTPAATGSRTSTLTVSDNAGNLAASQTVSLTGTGGGAPSALLSSSTVKFSNQNVSSTSAAQTITLSNGGTSALTLNGISIGGANAGEFATTNNCNGSVAAGSSCAIAVTFTPAAAGSRAATLTISDNAGNVNPSTQQVSLTGTGVATPSAAVSPNTLYFGSQNLGTASSASTLTLTNSGSAALSIASIAVSGTNSSDFTTTNNCGGSLALGGSCSIAVTFTPGAVGSRSATLTVTDNAGNVTGAAQTVALSGNGVGVAAATPSPAAYFFGNQNLNTTSAAQTITLTNSGTGALTVTSVALGGTNAADFAITANTCVSTSTTVQIAAGSSCAVAVTFTPAAVGSRSATLTFTDNAGSTNNTTTQTVSLGGAGLGVPLAAAGPATLTFATTALGSSATAQTVTLTNSGTGVLTVSNVVIGGQNPADFTQTNTCSTVAVNGTCTVSVTFTPTAAGARTANLHIVDNSGNVGSTQSVTLNGTGQGAAAPNGTVNPASLTFTSQNVGSSSATQTVTLSNSGTVALAISNIALGGANAADFTYTTTCGTSLAAGGSCSLVVTFTPTAGGSRTATLTITDNAGNTTGSTQAVSLTGTGATLPLAVLSTATLAFGNQNVDAESAAQTVTLTNTGSAALTIASIAVSGTNPGDFTAGNNCPTTSLAAGASCSIAITFTPGASGARSATLTVTDNSGNKTGATQTAALSGTGVATPAATLTPSTGITFANQNVGSSSTPQTVTLTNSGSAPLAITAIAASGGNAPDFTTTNNCGASLALGASCSIAVTFTPGAAGSRTSTLVVTDNAGATAGATQSIALSGTAIGVPAASLAPNALGFGNQSVAAPSAPQNVTITNTGSATLTVSNAVLSGANAADFAIANSCANVSAGSTCTIAVTFTPGATGARTATLTITDNAGNTAGSTQTVSLSGTGLGVPSAKAAPTSLTFASTALNTTAAAQTIQLTNAGTGALTLSSTTFVGANPADFAQTNNCGTSLAVNSSCTVSVTFTPSAAGTRTATLLILDNSGGVGSTQSVSLTGTGVAAPSAAVSTAALTFASQSVNTTSTPQTITVTNTGSAPLTISTLAFGGTNASEFAQTNTCAAAALAPNGTCSIAVSFTPAATGSRTATLTITDNSGNVTGATQTVALSGTGGAATAPPVPVSVTPNTGSATSQTFSAVYSDPYGAADLATLRLQINSTANGVNACYVVYSPASNQLYLYNNAGTTPSAAVTPGSSAQVSNSQCTLSGTGSSYTASGNTATLNVTLTFAATPPTNIYLEAVDKAGLNSGWVQEGTWGATLGLPAPVSVSPNSGTGTTQTFTAVYSDPNGAADLATVRMLFNVTANGLDACYVEYSRATNALYLAVDSGATFSAPVTPGSSAQVSNSQCTLSGTGSSYTTSGNNATLTVALTFSTAPPDNIYLLASENNGSSSGWVQEGTWGSSLGSPTVVSLSPASGSGATQTFTATVSDPNGAQHLATVRLLFNTSVNGVNACYVVYYPGSNQLYLYNNAGTGLSAALTPGSSGTVSNTQCSLSASGSSYSLSGDNGTLAVSLTFTGSAPQNVYVQSADRTGATSGWVQQGTWGVSAGLPVPVSVSPSSGTGAAQTFTATYSDPNGAGDFSTVRMLINSTASGVNACYVVYNRVTNGLYLANNAGSLLAPITPGSTATVSNSQCTLSAAGSSYSISGNTATLTLALTFTGSTAQKVYLEATENNGSTSGFVQEGTWTP